MVTNFLYYNLTTAQYNLQGRSMEIGLEMNVQELDTDRRLINSGITHKTSGR